MRHRVRPGLMSSFSETDLLVIDDLFLRKSVKGSIVA